MPKWIRRIFFIFSLFFLINALHAQNNPNGWDQGMSYGNSHVNSAENSIKNTDPNTIPGYESDPDQTKYYDGVTQDNTDSMDEAAKQEAEQSEEAQAINILHPFVKPFF